MKKLTLLYLFAGTLFSCSKENSPVTHADANLLGNWKLTEVYADPGDGSGSFSSVASEKTVTFYKNGTFTSNGQICNMSVASDHPSSGTFSIADSTLSSPSCNPDFDYKFELKNNALTVTYPCIEGCKAKYEKQ